MRWFFTAWFATGVIAGASFFLDEIPSAWVQSIIFVGACFLSLIVQRLTEISETLRKLEKRSDDASQ